LTAGQASDVASATELIADLPEEAMLIADNRTALGNATRIIDATGNATAPHFLDAAGAWGPETDSDYAGLEKILAGGHIIKAVPPIGALYTNALLP